MLLLLLLSLLLLLNYCYDDDASALKNSSKETKSLAEIYLLDAYK